MQEALRNINSQILSPRDKFFLKKKMRRFHKKTQKFIADVAIHSRRRFLAFKNSLNGYF